MMAEDIVSDSKPKLIWYDAQLDESCFIPEMSLLQGEHLQLICPESCQLTLLDSWFTGQSRLSIRLKGRKKYIKGVGHAIAVLLNGRALVANLTIQENIMLPFLYHYDSRRAVQAQLQVEEVAEMFGLDDILSERAGIRSPLVHGLVGLCRSVLQKANFVIMQQPCVSMDINEAEKFIRLAKQSVKSLDAGMVYLTSSVEDTGGFTFSEQVDLRKCKTL